MGGDVVVADFVGGFVVVVVVVVVAEVELQMLLDELMLK